MGFKFPYGNSQQLNLNWFIKKFKELLVDWQHEKESIDGALDAEIQRAEDALSDVYTARDTTIAAKNDALQAKADALTAAANAAQYWQNAAASANSAATSAVTALQAAQDAADNADQTSRDRALVTADKAAVAADKATVAADKAAVAADKAAVAQDKADTDDIKDAANAAALRSEGWADGTQNGTPVTSGSPYYQNNSKYFKEEAEAVLESIPEDYSDLAAEVAEQAEKINHVEFMPFIDNFPVHFSENHLGSTVEFIKNTIKVTKTSNSSTYLYYSIFGARYLGQNVNLSNVLNDSDFVNLDFDYPNKEFYFWRYIDNVVASSPNTIYIATKNRETGVITSANMINNSIGRVRGIGICGFFPDVYTNKNFALVFRRTNSNDEETIKIYFSFNYNAISIGNIEPYNKIASKAYNVNDFFQIGNVLYRVTQPIAQGGAITTNTNCVVTTLGAELTAILNS